MRPDRDTPARDTPITVDLTLGDVVTRHPGSTRVLERHGLDYCCGGRRPLDVACAELGIDPAELLDELNTVGPTAPDDWATMGPTELVDHLEATHHAFLHGELPRLDALADKVHGAHGPRHPELTEVQHTLEELRDELVPHLMKEERVLFPMIRQLDVATTRPGTHCGSIRNPISAMRHEHDRAGELLARLRALTGGYSAPVDGCASFRALYDGLAELESDTHLHVHKENNVLFPAVVALEERLTPA